MKVFKFPICLLLVFLQFLFFVVFPQATKAQELRFYDRILNYENCRFCYFVVLDVKSDNFSGKVAVETGDLYLFLEETKGFDRNQSKSFIKDLLLNNKPLLLDETKIDKRHLFLQVGKTSKDEFRIIKKNKQIEKNFSKGCIAFVSHYFLRKSTIKNNMQNCQDFIKKQTNELMLNYPFGLKEEAIIISKLFELEIPVRIEHLSNRLVIDK